MSGNSHSRDQRLKCFRTDCVGKLPVLMWTGERRQGNPGLKSLASRFNVLHSVRLLLRSATLWPHSSLHCVWGGPEGCMFTASTSLRWWSLTAQLPQEIWKVTPCHPLPAFPGGTAPHWSLRPGRPVSFLIPQSIANSSFLSRLGGNKGK